MKTRNKWILLWVAMFSVASVSAQKPTKVKSYLLAVGGHNQSAEFGSLVDLKKGKAYKVAEVPNEGDIDIMYAWGTSTNGNFLTPNSTSLSQFTHYRDKVAEDWKVKNRGMMVAIKADKENRKLFRTLKTSEDIEKLYHETARTVRTLPDYELRRNGPSRRLVGLAIGDLILFRSQDRNFYAAGLVLNVEAGTRGMIDIDFKITQ